MLSLNPVNMVGVLMAFSLLFLRRYKVLKFCDFSQYHSQVGFLHMLTNCLQKLNDLPWGHLQRAGRGCVGEVYIALKVPVS